MWEAKYEVSCVQWVTREKKYTNILRKHYRNYTKNVRIVTNLDGGVVGDWFVLSVANIWIMSMYFFYDIKHYLNYTDNWKEP